ncbi:MAG: heme-copper oxidase subunit III [Magnetococcales bacterium]|nr:heme-copper oxidase subunit III [Magnetococcales bacterium]
MSDSSTTEHAHHWEVSWAPMVVTIGILFLLPFTFSAHFVYDDPLLTTIFAGIGTPLTLAGIAKWVDEGITQKPLLEGVSPSGLPYFIISEVFIFLGFFVTYWTMRLSAGDAWPPEGTPALNLLLPVVMTVILVSSSWTYHIAEEKYEKGDLSEFRKWLMITIGLGTLFLGCTFYEYNHLMHLGFVPSSNAFSTIFYTITGFHASHVIIGLGVFIAILIPAFRGKTNKYLVFCGGVYWHFVDVIWFFVASQVYYW